MLTRYLPPTLPPNLDFFDITFGHSGLPPPLGLDILVENFFRLQIQLPQINPTLQNWNLSGRTLTLWRLCCFREGYRLVWQFGIDHVLKAKLKASVNIDLLFCVSQNKLPIWIVLSNHSSSLIRKLITVSWEFDIIEFPLIESAYPFPPSLKRSPMCTSVPCSYPSLAVRLLPCYYFIVIWYGSFDGLFN